MRQVIFIGGVNGCGKTTITEELNRRYGYFISKQKRTMVAIAKSKGIPWEEIPARYEELIEATAQKMAQDFRDQPSPVLLIDCHYGFKLQQSVKLNLEKKLGNTKEPFIQAIDDRMISLMIRNFEVSLVFLYTSPEIAYERVSIRVKNIGDEASTPKSLAKAQDEELRLFGEVIQKMNIDEQHQLILTNDSSMEVTVEAIQDFVAKEKRV